MAKFFGPTIALKIMLSGFSDGKEDFDVLGSLSWLVKSCPSSAPESFHLIEAHSWRFDIRSVPLLNSGGSVFPTFYGVMVI